MLSALLLACTGCVVDGSPEAVSPEASANETLTVEEREAELVRLSSLVGDPPEFDEVEVDDLAGQPTLALPDAASLEDVLAAASAGPDPMAGERFLMLVGTYLIDTRHPVSIAELEQIAAEAMPETNVNYIAREHGGHHVLSTNRRIDPSVQPWIRSRFEPHKVNPRISTQMNAYIRTDKGVDGSARGAGYSVWGILRMDAVWDGSMWGLSSYLNASGSERLVPTQSELDYYFYGGEGWRLVPAGS